MPPCPLVDFSSCALASSVDEDGTADPWRCCERPVFALHILPSLRSVRLTVGSRGAEPPRILLRTPREVVVRLPRPHEAASADEDNAVRTDAGGEEETFSLLLDFPVVEPAHGTHPLATSEPPVGSSADGASGVHGVHIVEARFAVDSGDTFSQYLQQSLLSPAGGHEDETGLRRLHCGTCSALLVAEGTLRRVLPLPSPFWHELADMWICHDDFKCNSDMAKKTPAHLRPRPGDCLQAEHHLMMHAKDFVPGSITWAIRDEDCGGLSRAASCVSSASSASAASFSPLSRARFWEEVICARCENTLGEALASGSSSRENQVWGGEDKKAGAEGSAAAEEGQREGREGGGRRAAGLMRRRGGGKEKEVHSRRQVELPEASSAAVEELWGGTVPGGVGGGGAEEAEREYARKGGVMVVLDDGLGSTMPWSVLQGESLQSLQGDGVSEAGAAGGSLGATSATSAAGVTCTQSGEACGRGLEAVGDEGREGGGDAVESGRRRRDVVPRSDVKVYKQWLSTSVEAGSADDLYADHSVPRRFASELLGVAGAHGIYKFQLRITSAGGMMRRPGLLVQLLSWNSRLDSNALPLLRDPRVNRAWQQGNCGDRGVLEASAGTRGDRGVSSRPRAADTAGGEVAGAWGGGAQVIVQCLYCSFEAADSSGTARRLYQQWTLPSETHVESVDISEEEEATLRRFLEQSTRVLPPPQRILNGLPVGFLFAA